MKLWIFGAIINTLVLSILFAIFVTVGGVGVDEFIGYFGNLGNAEETIRLILTTIKIDLVAQWYYTIAAISIFIFLLITLVAFPLVDLRMEDVSLSRPRMFLYTIVTILSIPLVGGIIMLLSLSGLKNNIFRARRKWLEEVDGFIEETSVVRRKQALNRQTLNSYGYSPEQVEEMTTPVPLIEESDGFFTKEDFEQNAREMNRLMETDDNVYGEAEIDDISDLEVEYDSHQPSYDRNFERRTSTNEQITDAELDRRDLKEKLIELEDQLDRIKSNQVYRAREISLRVKLREIEYDLEDNAKYLERLKNRQLR